MKYLCKLHAKILQDIQVRSLVQMNHTMTIGCRISETKNRILNLILSCLLSMHDVLCMESKKNLFCKSTVCVKEHCGSSIIIANSVKKKERKVTYFGK